VLEAGDGAQICNWMENPLEEEQEKKTEKKKEKLIEL
jgi:hypothetical protein